MSESLSELLKRKKQRDRAAELRGDEIEQCKGQRRRIRHQQREAPKTRRKRLWRDVLVGTVPTVFDWISGIDVSKISDLHVDQIVKVLALAAFVDIAAAIFDAIREDAGLNRDLASLDTVQREFERVKRKAECDSRVLQTRIERHQSRGPSLGAAPSETREHGQSDEHVDLGGDPRNTLSNGPRQPWLEDLPESDVTDNQSPAVSPKAKDTDRRSAAASGSG